MPPDTLPSLPPRPVHGHKGTFGTVCVLGGQSQPPDVMIGGPALAALGALRAGCGLAVLAVPRPLMASALIIAPSATGLALPVDRSRALMASAAAELIDERIDDFSVLAIGPGLGADEPQQQIVARLVARDETPLVIDADALNCLAAIPEFQKDFRAAAILTPHPGEFRRLARSLGMDIDAAAESERVQAAEQLAQRLGCVVVLKGHRTVVSDGISTSVNATGNVALATAGTGDVLTGVVAGLVAQHFRPPLGAVGARMSALAKSRVEDHPHRTALSLFDCARLGVHIHGRAADLWAKRNGDTGMTAMDLLALIPEAAGSGQ